MGRHDYRWLLCYLEVQFMQGGEMYDQSLRIQQAIKDGIRRAIRIDSLNSIPSCIIAELHDNGFEIKRVWQKKKGNNKKPDEAALVNVE
jgi:hypothetical protein